MMVPTCSPRREKLSLHVFPKLGNDSDHEAPHVPSPQLFSHGSSQVSLGHPYTSVQSIMSVFLSTSGNPAATWGSFSTSTAQMVSFGV